MNEGQMYLMLIKGLELMKKINGPESKCVYADNGITQCVNHRWIRDVEEALSKDGKP